MLKMNLMCTILTAGDLEQSLIEAKKDVTISNMTELLRERIKMTKNSNKGFIMIGYPRRAAEAKSLQRNGIFPDYTLYNPPTTLEVKARLEELAENDETVVANSIIDYNRSVIELRRMYCVDSYDISTDRPIFDVYNSIINTLSQKSRHLGLRTPRIVMLGYHGSGRRTQAENLRTKYGIITVNCGEVLKREVEKQSEAGMKVKTFVCGRTAVPDLLMTDILKARLHERDCATFGWVLTGYPRTRRQAELLKEIGFEPDRVIYLNINRACAQRRLTSRHIHPVTGELYHVDDPEHELQDIPPSERPLIRPGDQPTPALASEYTQFDRRLPELSEYYKELVTLVDADNEVSNVFEQVEAAVARRLPRKLHFLTD